MPTPSHKRGLTEQERQFGLLVAEGRGITEAFKAAFPERSEAKNAARVRERASKLYARDNIFAFVQTAIAEVAKRATEAAAKKLGLTREYVLESLHDIEQRARQVRPVLDKRGNPMMVETPTGEIAPAFTFDGKVATGALHLIGKELGMFTDRREVAGPLAGVKDEAALDAKLIELVREYAEASGKTIADAMRSALPGTHPAPTDAATPTPQGGGPNPRTGPIH